MVIHRILSRKRAISLTVILRGNAFTVRYNRGEVNKAILVLNRWVDDDALNFTAVDMDVFLTMMMNVAIRNR